ncbi:hypothetical protein ACFTSF_00290 [Kribbella sp. NPDC056951]|uniref:hypothetical protein n=1 Tax=Kribbella sp. NPDC056951 TaxID=3345978 RepID=UPI00363E085C
MSNDPRLVFLFDDSEVHIFQSLAAAEGWMEAPDVVDGEYTAALTDTGQVIRMTTTANHEVVLELTDETNPTKLRQLLRQHSAEAGQPDTDLDPIDFANRYWQLEWDTRWPKWPRWLDKRLHPHGPTQA